MKRVEAAIQGSKIRAVSKYVVGGFAITGGSGMLASSHPDPWQRTGLAVWQVEDNKK